MPKTHCAAPELASLLDGSTAGELIPELARHGLQQLIELEVAAVIGADRHERTDEWHGSLGKALQVCSQAVVVAMGVNVDGRRELLGLKVGDSESEGIWSEFIASLIAAGCEAVESGLTGAKLVISDAHGGLTKAISRQLQ